MAARSPSPDDWGSTRVRLAAEEPRSRPGPSDADRQTVVPRRAGRPAGAPGDGQPEGDCGVLELAGEETPILVVAVVEHVDGRASQALGEQR